MFSKFLHVGDEVLRNVLGDGREGGPIICSSGCGEVAFSLLVAVRGCGDEGEVVKNKDSIGGIFVQEMGDLLDMQMN